MKKLTAQALAWVAEAADGNRDRDLWLVRKGDGYLLTDQEPGDAQSILLVIRSPSKKKQERKRRTIDIPADWDALFLSESAVEKFLIPYYTAQRLLSESEMSDLKAQYYAGDPDAKHGRVIGIVHKPPSRPSLLYEDFTEKPIKVTGGIPVDIPLTLLEDEPGETRSK